MANATANLGYGVVRRSDDGFLIRSSATLASATTFYQNAMIGTTSGGYLAKFDDTAAMTFAGVVAGDSGDQDLPAGTAGDGTIDLRIQQPYRLEVAIASVAVTDIGRLAYATFDNAGSLAASDTTYSNVIGVVVDVVATNIALVEPLYGLARRGGGLAVMAASGAATIRQGTVLITKSSGAAAVTLADPTTGVHDGLEMTFISTTAQAHTLSNAAGSGFNAGGAASDVGTFGGAKGDNIKIIAYGGVWYVTEKTNVTLG